jgi:hypothetical protein
LLRIEIFAGAIPAGRPGAVDDPLQFIDKLKIKAGICGRLKCFDFTGQQYDLLI